MRIVLNDKWKTNRVAMEIGARAWEAPRGLRHHLLKECQRFVKLRWKDYELRHQLSSEFQIQRNLCRMSSTRKRCLTRANVSEKFMLHETKPNYEVS